MSLTSKKIKSSKVLESVLQPKNKNNSIIQWYHEYHLPDINQVWYFKYNFNIITYHYCGSAGLFWAEINQHELFKFCWKIGNPKVTK